MEQKFDQQQKIDRLPPEKQEQVKAYQERLKELKDKVYNVIIDISEDINTYFENLETFFTVHAEWKWIEAKGIQEALKVIREWRRQKTKSVGGVSTFKAKRVELMGVLHFLSKYNGRGDSYLDEYIGIIYPLTETVEQIAADDREIQDLDYKINMILTGLEEASENELREYAASPIMEEQDGN